MNDKQQKIINLLSSTNEDWVITTYLAESIHVSERSVRNYINQINSEFPDLILSGNKGYVLSKAKLDEYHLNFKKDEDSPSYRIFFIIKTLLLDSDKVDVFDLAEELSISEATLKADLKKVKDVCLDYDIKIHTSHDYIYVDGEESNKRKLIRYIFYKDAGAPFVDCVSSQNFFNENNTDVIRDTIVEVLNHHKYFINDYALSNLTLHISIAKARMNANNYLTNPQNVFVNRHVFSIAKELSEKLEEKLDISYTESEINDLAILLSCNTTQQAENELQLEEVIGREELQFVIQILDDLNNTYLLDLNYSSFLARFTVHMKNLTNRIQSNKFISNPLASTLKLSCPFIYEAAVFLATRINQKMHTTLPEDEIGFIAFHIGNAIEELNNLSNKLKTILLFPSYYDMEQTIINRINQYFSNELIIADIITSEEQLSSYSFDYVLSTVPITRPIACPYTMIQPFLTNLDVQVIKKTIAVILSNKRKENLQQKIRNYTSPDLFFRNVSVKNQEEAILLLSEELTSRKMVTDSFTKEVFEREQMSSTAFGKIAIPHSMNMNSPKTSIAVLINDKAIPWKESSVNIVLLIAINFEERRAFRSLFNHLTQALLDFSAKDILSIANYNDFIEFLSNCDSL